MRNLLPWVGISFLVLFGYSNCSNYSDNDLFNGNYMCPEGNCAMSNGQVQSLKVSSTSMKMGCEEEQLQIGGYCNPGDVKNQFIMYSLSRGGTAVSFTNSQNSLTLNPGCENGRFNLVLRRPNDSGVCSGCAQDYQLNLQIYTHADGQAPIAGVKYTDTVKIQWGGCANPASPAPVSAEPPAWSYAMVASARCTGVGPTSASIACSGGASVSWVAGFNPTSITATCPMGKAKVGGCINAGTCSSSTGGTVPVCTGVNVACNLECY